MAKGSTGSGTDPDKDSTLVKPEKDFNSIKLEASSLDVKDLAPTEAMPVTRISSDQVQEIVTKVAADMQVSPPVALASIYLLLNKGAANVKAPNSMQVNVLNEKKEEVSLSKLDLMAAYRRVTGNNYLRRLAETLAVEIAQFAEKNGLRGELATRINNKLVSNSQVPLTLKEMAWASSFCQSVANLASLSSDRLPGLLAEDYSQRFSKVKGSNQPQANKKARKGQKKKKERSAKTSTTD